MLNKKKIGTLYVSVFIKTIKLFIKIIKRNILLFAYDMLSNNNFPINYSLNIIFVYNYFEKYTFQYNKIKFK